MSLYYLRPQWSLTDIYFDDDRIFVMFSYLAFLFLSTFVIYPFICDVIKIYILNYGNNLCYNYKVN